VVAGPIDDGLRTCQVEGLQLQLGVASRSNVADLAARRAAGAVAESDAMVYPFHRAESYGLGLIERWRRAGRNHERARRAARVFFATERERSSVRAWRPRRAARALRRLEEEPELVVRLAEASAATARSTGIEPVLDGSRACYTRRWSGRPRESRQLTDDVQTDHAAPFACQSLRERASRAIAHRVPSTSSRQGAERQPGHPELFGSGQHTSRPAVQSALAVRRSGPCLDRKRSQRRGGPGSAAGAFDRGEQPTAVEVCKTFGSSQSAKHPRARRAAVGRRNRKRGSA